MKYTKFLPVLVLLLLSLVPLFDLLHPGLPITHDGQDHVARIANFYQNLKEGIIIPRWAPNLNWGYGHPILMFLYPLPSYIASFFHFLGFSLVDSLKLVFGATFVFSGFAMYIWVRNFLDEKAALVAAVLYLFAPYRFIDLYVRGAIGEHVAFIFPPLVFYFLLKLSKQYSWFYIVGGSGALAGLILSHNAITLMFLPVVFLYGIFLIKTHKKNKLIHQYITILAMGFGLSSFFWIPAFFEGKYTLRDIVTAGEYASRFVQFKDLIYSPWSYGGSGEFSPQVGVAHWILILLSPWIVVILFKKRNNLWIVTLALFIIFWLTLFVMTQASNIIWQTLTTLQKFQFPWRFLSLTVFVTSILGGIVTLVIPKNLKLAFLFTFFVVLLYINKEYWHAKEYRTIQETFFTSVYYGTTDTGESAPIWSVRFMEHAPLKNMEVIDGQATITQIQRTSTLHEYKIVAMDKTRLKENTLFFPGWDVLVDAKEVPIEFQDQQHRGLMTFFVEKGNHFVQIRFKETKLRLLADIITFLSLVILGFYSILKRKILWQHFQLF